MFSLVLDLMRTFNGALNGAARRAHSAVIQSVLCLVLFFPCAGSAAQSGDFTYEVGGSTVTITGYTGTSGTVVVPPTIDGMPVTGIGYYAFGGSSAILISLTLPETLTSIGTNAFTSCWRLTSLTLPDRVTNISREAFSWCRGVTNVAIGMHVASIGEQAFNGCTALTDVTLPSSVTSIGEQAFSTCSVLARITVDEHNANYIDKEGVLLNREQTTLLQCPGGKIGSFDVPSTVTNILHSAFVLCRGLTNITLPDSLISIGPWAFAWCSGLTSIAVPNGTIDIGVAGFYACTGITNIALPSSVISMGEEVFGYCYGLQHITLPNSLLAIPDYAFMGCTGLTMVIVGDHVAAIGSRAFQGCTGLTSLCFAGNRPKLWDEVFKWAHIPTMYYLAGRSGWGSSAAIWQDPPYALWAQAWGLAAKYPNAGREQDDADQDGLTNAHELAAGTNPTDGQSTLAFETLPRPDDLSTDDKTSLEPSEFGLLFQSVPGKSYVVQSAATLGGPWSPVAFANATTKQKRVVLARPAGERFFRVMIQ